MSAAFMTFDGVDQGTGTWGDLASSADHKVAWITGAGILTVGFASGAAPLITAGRFARAPADCFAGRSSFATPWDAG